MKRPFLEDAKAPSREEEEEVVEASGEGAGRQAGDGKERRGEEEKWSDCQTGSEWLGDPRVCTL